MVDLQTIGVLMTGVSVTVAAIYYMFTLRINMRTQQLALKTQELALKSQEQNLETRQAQLFMQVYTQSLGQDFIKQWYMAKDFEYKGLEDFREKYGPDKNPDFFYSYVSIGNYLDGLGVLVKRGIMDISLVNDMMGSYAIWWWRIMEPYVKDDRISGNAPDLLSGAEYLVNEMMRVRKGEGKFFEWRSSFGIR